MVRRADRGMENPVLSSVEMVVEQETKGLDCSMCVVPWRRGVSVARACCTCLLCSTYPTIRCLTICRKQDCNISEMSGQKHLDGRSDPSACALCKYH